MKASLLYFFSTVQTNFVHNCALSSHAICLTLFLVTEEQQLSSVTWSTG